MTHLFVSYEIAVKLKELGFDEPCLYTVFLESEDRPVYNGHQMEWVDWNNFIPTTNDSVGKCFTSAPLYQQVVDWLRDTHMILAFADTTVDFTTHSPTVQKLGESHIRVSGQIEFDNYYEALTKAINEALKLFNGTVNN